MAHLAAILTALAALLYALDRIGVFDKKKPKQRKPKQDKTYEHQWPEE